MCPKGLALLIAVAAAAQEAPLPELRTQATDAGSVFIVRNRSALPLTAYLIELVDYPGSSYALLRDDLTEPIPPGGEKRIPVTNMTAGASPEYVKLRAAIYADGSLSGLPEKTAKMVERRKIALETTRELIRRLEAAAGDKAVLAADLKKWHDSLPPPRVVRKTLVTVAEGAARTVIAQAIADLEAAPIAKVLENLRVAENTLRQSKPAL